MPRLILSYHKGNYLELFLWQNFYIPNLRFRLEYFFYLDVSSFVCLKQIATLNKLELVFQSKYQILNQILKAENLTICSSNFNSGGAGTNHVKSLDTEAGGVLNFGLINLQQEADNEVDNAKVGAGAVANFNSGGEGTNHVKALDTTDGGVLNFGLQNLRGKVALLI